MTRRVLVVATNHGRYPGRERRTGLWLGEWVHFDEEVTRAGYEIDLVSPQGGQVPIDPESLKWLVTDGALRTFQADLTRMKRLEATFAPADVASKNYDAIYFTGGHGTMWDFPNSEGLQRLARDIYEQGGIVSSVCHGAAGLLNIRLSDGTALVRNRRVTGYADIEELVSRTRGLVEYSLEKELRGRGAHYERSWLPMRPFVVVDGRLITGQNPFSTKKVARALLLQLAPRVSGRTAPSPPA